MNYKDEDFFDLIEDVERQGGVLQEDLCKAHRYEFSGEHSRPVTIAGCGNQALFTIPDLEFAGQPQFGEGVTENVCAVDDEMGKWPRFGGDKFAREDA